MQMFGTLLANGLSLYVMTNLSYESAGGSRNLQSVTAGYGSATNLLCRTVPRLAPSSGLSRVPDVVWMRPPIARSWDSDFAIIYVLIVILESLAVLDTSWRHINNPCILMCWTLR
jgi:hypothetical protein